MVSIKSYESSKVFIRKFSCLMNLLSLYRYFLYDPLGVHTNNKIKAFYYSFIIYFSLCQNTWSLNIIVAEKKEKVISVTGPHGGRAFPLEALVFSIDGHEFNGIDIHNCNNNEKLNELLAQSMVDPISFTINRNGHSTTHTFSELISQRLRRFFLEGLCSF